MPRRKWVTAENIVSFYFMTKQKNQRNVLQSDTPLSRWHFMCSCWGKITLADLHQLVLVLEPKLHLKVYHHPWRSEKELCEANVSAKVQYYQHNRNRKTIASWWFQKVDQCTKCGGPSTLQATQGSHCQSCILNRQCKKKM